MTSDFDKNMKFGKSALENIGHWPEDNFFKELSKKQQLKIEHNDFRVFLYHKTGGGSALAKG